jgi:preprotein translocase subunit SecD
MQYTRACVVVALFTAGCGQPMHELSPNVAVEFRFAETDSQPQLTEANVVGSEEKVYLEDAIQLSNEHIASVGLSEFRQDHGEVRQAPMPTILFELTPAGAELMEKLTADNIGKRLAIIIDGQVVCAPTIKAPVKDRIEIHMAGCSEAETKSIVRKLAGE